MIEIKGFETGLDNHPKLNQILSRLAQKDSGLWGEDAAAEAAIRLNWVDLPSSSRDLLPILDALSAWSRELGHQEFVLCGMGGSSLAPEVISKTYQKSLTVLDSTDPDHVAKVIGKDLRTSCFVIGSKSGSTIETASQKIAVETELRKQGLDPKNHLVIITDPGSPLDQDSRAAHYRVINADPYVGGRFSALSAFGLVPAALIGVDVSVLLDDAEMAAIEFAKSDSIVVKVASALATKEFAIVGFCDANSPVPGLGDWIEQLIAESTGKDEKGVLPVVTDKPISTIYPVITFGSEGDHQVIGTLGEHFIFWEWVTALTCFLLKVDPFNQPNVTEAKNKTGSLLAKWGSNQPEPMVHALETPNLLVYSDQKLTDLRSYLRNAIEKGQSYLAIMAYLNRLDDEEIISLRALIEEAGAIPTTFGWGPRFLHSTGQFHKGGPKSGSFIQITGVNSSAWSISGKDYDFGKLIMAQALGDFEALSDRNYPVIRIHLKNRASGIAELLETAKGF